MEPNETEGVDKGNVQDVKPESTHVELQLSEAELDQIRECDTTIAKALQEIGLLELQRRELAAKQEELEKIAHEARGDADKIIQGKVRRSEHSGGRIEHFDIQTGKLLVRKS